MTVDQAAALRAEVSGKPATARHEEKPQCNAICTCPMHPEVQQDYPGDYHITGTKDGDNGYR